MLTSVQDAAAYTEDFKVEFLHGLRLLGTKCLK